MGSATILIKGPHVIDPGRGLDEVSDILVRDGIIAAVGPILSNQAPEGCRVIHAGGLVASPGFVDVHCHLREPGFEYKETIATGTRGRGPRRLFNRLLYAQYRTGYRQCGCG